MRGRKPTPTETLKARGSRKVSGRPPEPTDAVAVPECPEWLDDAAREEWGRLAPLLLERRTVTMISSGVLAALCAEWSLYRKAVEEVNRLLADPKAEAMQVRRWTATRNEAYKNYLKGAIEFGLTPSSKTRVHPEPEKESADDGKAKFFRVG